MVDNYKVLITESDPPAEVSSSLLDRRLGMTEEIEQQPQPKKWKILEKSISEKWPVFIGDFEYVNEILAEKPSNSAWLLLQFLNALTRSFGQVIFANNPVSGFLVMVAVGIADYLALFAAIYASTLSFVLSLIFRQDSSAILNGGFGYNPVLHGIVSISVLPSIYPQINVFAPKFWLFLLIVTLMSVYLTSALNSLFKHIGRYPIPCFTLPFNLLQFMLIYCLLHNTVPLHIVSPHLLIAPGLAVKTNQSELEEPELPGLQTDNNSWVDVNNASTTNQNGTNLNWGETFSGTIVALSQVYGLNNTPCAALMYLALLIYSPIMTGFAYMGSLVGTLLGIMLTDDLEQVYIGAWGYNGLLCAAALGGFCFVLNFQSTMLAFASVIFTTVLQHFLTPLFVLMNFPILTMPFNITTILFMFITTEKEESLARPETLTFPESHRHSYKSMAERPKEGYLRRSQIYEGKEEI